MFNMLDIALQAIGSNSITSPITSQLQVNYMQRVYSIVLIPFSVCRVTIPSYCPEYPYKGGQDLQGLERKSDSTLLLLT